MMYSQDFDETMPRTYFTNPNTLWTQVLQPYVKNTGAFNCPSSTIKWNGNWSEAMTYGFSVYFEGISLSMAQIAKPAETVLMGDGTNFRLKPRGHTFESGALTRLVDYRHSELTNAVFVDGHVKAYKQGNLETQATSEDGTALTGNNIWTLWNMY